MLKFCTFLVLLAVNLSYSAETTKPLKVTVLYEALCPHSVSFFANQLVPYYDSIKSVIDLELVPFGKATQKLEKRGWTFQCQHGERECTLNMYHACGLKYASNQMEQVKFVNCMMSQNVKVTATDENTKKNEDLNILRKCSESSGLSFDTVQSCSTGVEGRNLLSGHGNRTLKFSTNIAGFGIPTIIFRETYDSKLQERALREFYVVVNELCAYQTYQQYINYGSCYYCIPGQNYYYPYSQYNSYGGYTPYGNSYGSSYGNYMAYPAYGK